MFFGHYTPHESPAHSLYVRREVWNCYLVLLASHEQLPYLGAWRGRCLSVSWRNRRIEPPLESVKKLYTKVILYSGSDLVGYSALSLSGLLFTLLRTPSGIQKDSALNP